MKKNWFAGWIDKPLANLPHVPSIKAGSAAQMLAPGFNSFARSAIFIVDTTIQSVNAEEPCSSVAATINVKALYETFFYKPVNLKT